MKRFITGTKPFFGVGAKVLKPLPATDPPTTRRRARGIRQGTTMFKLDHFRLNSRRALLFGALAIGALALSASASAAPLPLFPFIMTPPVQSQDAQVQAAP